MKYIYRLPCGNDTAYHPYSNITRLIFGNKLEFHGSFLRFVSSLAEKEPHSDFEIWKAVCSAGSILSATPEYAAVCCLIKHFTGCDLPPSPDNCESIWKMFSDLLMNKSIFAGDFFEANTVSLCFDDLFASGEGSFNALCASASERITEASEALCKFAFITLNTHDLFAVSPENSFSEKRSGNSNLRKSVRRLHSAGETSLLRFIAQRLYENGISLVLRFFHENDVIPLFDYRFEGNAEFYTDSEFFSGISEEYRKVKIFGAGDILRIISEKNTYPKILLDFSALSDSEFSRIRDGLENSLNSDGTLYRMTYAILPQVHFDSSDLCRNVLMQRAVQRIFVSDILSLFMSESETAYNSMTDDSAPYNIALSELRKTNARCFFGN